MISNGTRPRPRKKTDFSYEHTFGTPVSIPGEVILDPGLIMFDQNAMGLPYGCTGCTQADISSTEDKVAYSPFFTYEKTCFMEGHAQDQGCLIENAIKSTRVYGLKGDTQTEDQAYANRRGAFFDVDKVDGEYFMGFLSAIAQHLLPLSLGTPWFPEWQKPGFGNGKLGPDAILPMPDLSGFKVSFLGYLLFSIFGAIKKLFGAINQAVWHNHVGVDYVRKNSKGEWIRNGEIFIRIKSHQGKDYGDNGFVYLSREVCNAVFEVVGTQSFMYTKAKPADMKLIQQSTTETLLSYYQRWLVEESKKKPNVETMPQETEKTINARVYDVAKASLGHDIAPTQNEFGCAESVSTVLRKAGVPNFPTHGFLGTSELFKWLQANAIAVDEPTPGCVVISPTGTSTKGTAHGHTGIVAYHGFLSNDSETGLFRENYTKESWDNIFHKWLGFPVYYFTFGDK